MENSVSVVVVTWNSSRTISQCLESLRSNSHVAQVIVVDNASADDSVILARDLADLLIENSTNVGFPVGVNLGLEHCSSPLTLLLNPDVVLQPDVIAHCVDLLEREDAGVVGANLRTATGAPDRAAARRFKGVRTVFLETIGVPRVSSRLDWQYLPGWNRTESRQVPCINGAFMLLRTDLLKEVGGLDESVFMYLEDLDLCWRLRVRGRPVWFCAQAVATHVGGASTAAGNIEQQAVAHLHRLDGTIEFIVRRSRIGTRQLLVGLFLIQSLRGVVVGASKRDLVQTARHRAALRWLLRQLRSRTPPPPVPS